MSENLIPDVENAPITSDISILKTLFSIFDSDAIIPSNDTETAKILKMIKEKYVSEHHSRAISYLESKDAWRTFVGTPRKEVKRKNKDELINYLYEYYQTMDSRNSTLMEVFSRMQEYRLNALNRAVGTIERDRQVFERFVTEDLFNKRISAIDGDLMSNYINNKSKELKLKERALKDSVQLLNRIFEYAVRNEGIILINPMDKVDIKNYYQNCDTGMKTANEKIFTEDEIEAIKKRINAEMSAKKYDAIGYAMLFSIETGVRVAEIPTLRWSDISDEDIHIHTQQRITRKKGERIQVVELPFTKDERRHPHGGRFFPMTDEIRDILNRLKDNQEKLGISSEFVFCNEDGSWFNKDIYSQRLRRLCRREGLTITNNHAFRMSLNSNVLIPLGLTVTERAAILGHSVETNERNYSHLRTESIKDIGKALNNRDNKPKSA